MLSIIPANRQIPEQELFSGFYSVSLSRFFMACRLFIKPVSGIWLFCFQGAPGSRLRALLRDEGFDGLRVRWHDAHAAGQVFDAVEGGGAVRVAAQGFADGGGKFDGQRRFQHDHGRVFLRKLAGHFHAVGGVGVYQHAVLLMHAADGGQTVGMGAFAAGKAELFARGGKARVAAQIKLALLRQRLAKEGAGGGGVAAQQVEHEALEVAGLADVHAGAAGFKRFGAAAHAVQARAEEFIEHVVFIGGDDEAADGQPHHARHVARADVAEVAAGHGEIDGLRFALRGLHPAGEVIDHLRQQPRPVDAVDGADAVAALEGQIGADGLDDVLAVVKHAFDGDVVDVGVLQAEHLRLLEGAHAPVRAEHEHADAALAAHGVFGGAAGVAAGGAQDVELRALAAVFARQLVFKQVAQQLHGHVFEREGGAVGQGFEIKAFFQLFERRDGARAKHCGRVGFGAQLPQVGGGNVVDVEREDFKRQRGIAFIAPHLAQAGQTGSVQLRVMLRQIQPAIGCQALQQDVAELAGGGIATGGEVVHDYPNLKTSLIFLYQKHHP